MPGNKTRRPGGTTSGIVASAAAARSAAVGRKTVNAGLRAEAFGKADGGEEAGLDEVVMPGYLLAGDPDRPDRKRRAAALPVSAVGAERGAAVGRGGQQARAAAADPRAEKPPAHLGRPAQPEVVGRHRHDGILVQQRYQRGDVVPL